jgi:hypothetical protein
MAAFSSLPTMVFMGRLWFSSGSATGIEVLT